MDHQKISRIQHNLSRRLFALASVSIIIGGLVRQIESTGAVPGDEFVLAGLLYSLLTPWAMINVGVAASAAVVMILQWRANSKARGIVPVLACAFLIAGFFLPVLAVVGLLFLLGKDEMTDEAARRAASGEDGEHIEDLGHALSRLRAGDFLHWWGALCVLASISALSITLMESATYISSFAGFLYRSEVLWHYRLRLVDLAFAFGAGASLLYLLPILWLRLRRAGGRAAVVQASRAVAFLVTVFICAGLFFVMGDEIWATGVADETIGLVGVLFLLLLRHMRSRQERMGHRPFGNEKPTTMTAWGNLFLSIMTPPSFLMPRRLDAAIKMSATKGYVLHAFFAGVWLAVFVYASYPELEDFRSKLISLGVVTAVNLFTLVLFSLFQLFPRFRRGKPGPIQTTFVALLILGAFVLTQAPISGEMSLIINEYSRFGIIIKKASIRELLCPANQMGCQETKENFAFHGDGEDRYPKAELIPDVGDRPPIVIVLWDAGRPDHIGAYGYQRPTTPNVDLMAKDAVIFEQAYSGSTATTCGVRHLFTGNYSTRYMLSEKHDPFFVHALRRHGYRKFLITATGTDYNGVSIESFLRQGPAPKSDGSQFRHLSRDPSGMNRERPDKEKTKNVIDAWREIVKAEGSKGLHGSLTFLHLTGTHFPWKNNNLVKDFGKGNIDLYDGETAKVDVLTKQAFDALKELGVYDDAIIALIADHGTGLMEHGRWAGFLPYEEQIRIPFIMKVPGVPHRRVQSAVSTIDLAPTLLSLFEPEAKNEYDGVSLLPLMTGKTKAVKRRYVVSLCAFEDAYALIADSRYKLHVHRSEDYTLLFDLVKDPGEAVNLYDSHPQLHDELVEVMDSFLWEGRDGFANPYHYRDWSGPDEP